MKINLLDCTLRDGGYLNDWDFGQDSILSIYRRLVKANVEAIEVGFLDDRRPYDKNRAIYPNTDSICDFYRNEPKGNVFITAMTTGLLHDGHCSLDSIGDCNNGFIDGIRVPFKQQNIKEAIDYCYGLKEKGYKVFVNPTSITTYSDKEMLDLIEQVNKLEPYSMALVDTYGLLHKEKLLKYFYLLDTNLKEGISIAYHAHNNFQLAFSNSSELLRVRSKRNLIIDTSLYGMGKSAGNCNTELFAQYLNEFYDKNYDLSEILNAIELHILKYMDTGKWGYRLSYYISATNKCHPYYVKFLEDKNMLGVKEINDILSQITPEKALNYDKDYIQELYLNYQSKKTDDSKFCTDLTEKFAGKTIVLIGPGSSINSESEKIKSYIQDNNAITISVNHPNNIFKTDYIFVSNSKRYNQFMEYYKKDNSQTKLIVTSNIDNAEGIADYKINYTDLTDKDSFIGDTALFLAIKLLSKLNVKQVYLAGFDGFLNNDERYYNPDLQFYNQDISKVTIKETQKQIQEFRKNLKIEFITESNYEVKEE